jgi:hypothetical protein
MTKALEAHEVVPDVIDTLPPAVVNVSYPSGVSVNIGKELTPTQVKDQPTVKWDADNSAYYTLCMTGKNIGKINYNICLNLEFSLFKLKQLFIFLKRKILIYL